MPGRLGDGTVRKKVSFGEWPLLVVSGSVNHDRTQPLRTSVCATHLVRKIVDMIRQK
jgi:hypothetical protein